MNISRMSKSELASELRKCSRQSERLRAEVRRMEQELTLVANRGEEMFRLICENAGDLIAVLDLDGRRIYNSPSYKNVLGEPTGLIGSNSFNEIHPDDRAQIRKVFQETVRTGVGQRSEYRFLLRDGSIRYIESMGNLIRDENGEPSKVLVVSRDVTDQQHADRKIRLLAQTVASTKDCVAISDLDGRILFVNDAFLDASGYEQDELVGQPITSVLSPSSAVLYEKQVVPATLAGGWNGNIYGKRKDGTEFPQELWTSLVRTESGEPVAVVGVTRDIADRLQAERMQRATYRISEATQTEHTFEELLHFIHTTIGDIIPANNFYIALYDEKKNLLSWPYFVDEVDPPPETRPPGKGLTEYVLRTGRPLLATPSVFEELVASGEVEAIGAPSIDWMGVPLMLNDKPIGVLVAQSYSEGVRFTPKDVEMLTFVSSQVAMSIDRRGGIESLRESEARFRAVFERGGIGMVLTDLAGRILESNRVLQDLLDYSPTEFRSKSVADILHQDDATTEFRRFLEAGMGSLRDDATTSEVRFLHNNGTVVWGRLTTSVIRDAYGGPLFIIGMIEDITKRKRGEERILKLNECFISFGPDPRQNINRMTELCGELMGGVSALYNRLEGAKLHSWGRWHVPPDFLPITSAAGHICMDVIQENSTEMKVVRDLHLTSYAETDPSVLRHNLRTYVGQPVHYGGKAVGSLCVLYQHDYVPTDDDRRLIGIIASAISVEEQRKDAAETLQASEFRFRTLFENSNDAIFLMRGEEFIHCNRKTEEMFGGRREQIIGRTPIDFSPELQRDGKPSREGARARIRAAAGGTPQHFEWQHSRIDGSFFDAEVSLNPVEIKGETILQAIVRDITERKAAEQALRSAEAKFRALIEHSSEAIGLIDEHGIIIYESPASTRMLGYAPGELLGRGLFDYLPPEDQDPEVRRMKRLLLRPGATVSGEILFRHKGGTWRWLDVVGTNLLHEDAVGAIVLNYRDITERKHAEEQLYRSRQMLQLVLDNIPQRVFWKDHNFRYVGCNRPFAMDAGLGDPSEIRGRTDFDLSWKALAPIYRADDADVMESNTSRMNYEEPLPGQGGSTLWLKTSKVPMHDQEGSVIGVLGTYEDITDRKRAQEELMLEKTRFQQLYENVTLAIVMLDENDCILEVNPAFTKIFQYTSEEIRGHRINDILVPPEYAEQGMSLSAEARRGRPVESEGLRRRKDGSLAHVQIYGVPIVADGVAIGIFGIYEDTSERRRAEEKMREQATLLDVSRDAIGVLDLEGNVLYWNKGAEALYGYRTDEMLNTKAVSLYTPDSLLVWKEAFERVLATGEWSGEIRNATRAGKDVTVQSRWTLVRDSTEKPKSILVVSTDVTEKKKLEAQFHHAQRLETIGTLAGGIAHDLNNVLAPILMSIELLQLKATDERTKNLIRTIESSAKRGSDIVKQVLTFARSVEGERILLQPKHLIRDMERIAVETFPKSIEIRCDISKNLWTIEGDATQLHQVLLNLCINARDAMPQGGTLEMHAENVVLTDDDVHVHLNAHPGQYVLMSVRDTGIGIPPDVMDKIFDPFFTTKEVGKGTGLGLSTALGIIEGHKGFISVSSDWGKGSEFKVFIPAFGDVPVESGHDAPAELPRGHGEHILIVDDESPIREILRDSLEMQGYSVFEAKDGMEAAVVFEKHRAEIQLVVTDMMMPTMDGAAVIRLLRRMSPGIRIIVVSGMAEEQQLSEGLKKNIQGFLQKPFRAERLLRTIDEVLKTPSSGTMTMRAG